MTTLTEVYEERRTPYMQSEAQQDPIKSSKNQTAELVAVMEGRKQQFASALKWLSRQEPDEVRDVLTKRGVDFRSVADAVIAAYDAKRQRKPAETRRLRAQKIKAKRSMSRLSKQSRDFVKQYLKLAEELIEEDGLAPVEVAKYLKQYHDFTITGAKVKRLIALVRSNEVFG